MSLDECSDRDFADVSPQGVRQADQVCDCFEATWQSGRRPRIEEFVEGVPEPTRTVLLRELIGLDASYRRLRGESPRLSEYRSRFPDRGSAWLARAVDAPSEPDGARVPAEAAPAGLDGEPSGDRNDSASSPWPPSRRLGKFELIERVGVGSFGAVWRARDLQLGREVAVKIPHAELVDSPRDLARIYREARTVAQLRHPGIVSVHEVLVHDGMPILVSDFVEGTTLRDLLAAQRLSHREAAALVAKVAEALGYAHALGAIHRDIKPANIMMDDESAGHARRPEDREGTARTTSRGADAPSSRAAASPGEPRIVDFGLAFGDQDGIHLTQGGQLVGTPAYMSPEQADDGTAALDGRTDIYSLGVVLYEALSGALPFSGTRSEVLRRLATEEPRRLRQLDRTIAGDLETICQKAMAKDRRGRYETALELADDLKRYLDGEPIRARRVALWERAWRHARRRPAEAAAMAMVAVTALAVVGLAVGWRFHLRLRHEYLRTDQARQAEATQRRHAEAYLYYNRMALAEREYSANNVERVERLLEDCPPRLRGWEWSYLKRQCHHELFSIRHASDPTLSLTVTRVVFSPDGRHLATACKDGMIRLWDASTGESTRLIGREESPVFGLAYHPGGGRIASSSQDGLVTVWEVATGARVRTLRRNDGSVYCLAYSPDGRRLASGGGYPPWESIQHLRTPGVVIVWDEATGRECFSLRGHSQNVMGLSYSPDGRRLASVSGGTLAVPLAAGTPGELMIWDAESGAPIRTVHGHDGPLTAVAYSPDGRALATSSWDRTVALWDAEAGTRRLVLAGHQDWVRDVAFEPSGLRLATAGADGAVKLWDVATGRSLATFRGHTQNVTCATFEPAGRRLASASSDQTAKVWDTSAGREALTWRGRGPIVRLAFFPDSRRLVVASNPEGDDGRIRPTMSLLDAAIGEARALGTDEPRLNSLVHGVAVSPAGDLVAAAFVDQKAEVRDAATGAVRATYTIPSCDPHAAAFSPDGGSVAVVGLAPVAERAERFVGTARTGGFLSVWDLTSSRARWVLISAETGKIRGVAFSPDSRLIATADNQGSVTLWDAADGSTVRRLLGHRRLVSWVAFSPDGRRVASASWDQTARVWDVETGRSLVDLRGHMRSVLCVAYSPDGTRLATGSEDQTVKLWDADTGEEVLTLRGHKDVVSSVAFSPDGRRLASAGADGSVLIREADPLPAASSDQVKVP